MPGAFTYTRITWSISPMVPQVPCITPGSPLCPWCCRDFSWRGARQKASGLFNGLDQSRRRICTCQILKLALSPHVKHHVYTVAFPSFNLKCMGVPLTMSLVLPIFDDNLNTCIDQVNMLWFTPY